MKKMSDRGVGGATTELYCMGNAAGRAKSFYAIVALDVRRGRNNAIFMQEVQKCCSGERGIQSSGQGSG